MDIPNLLKRLDGLNEEGEKIQRDLRTISGEIANLLFEQEKIKTNTVTLEKKSAEMTIEHEATIVELDVEIR